MAIVTDPPAVKLLVFPRLTRAPVIDAVPAMVAVALSGMVIEPVLMLRSLTLRAAGDPLKLTVEV
ncbi:MAG TPA: hypothetical protein VN641_16475, partial [Urbifossiella sp.]|nr:hypothetical protein [Urbifossiella sp.]